MTRQNETASKTPKPIDYDNVLSAFRTGKKDKVAYWVKKFGVCSRITWRSDYTLLHFAASFGWHDEIRRWREEGLITDPTMERMHAAPPIFLGAAAGNFFVVDELVKAGADIEMKFDRKLAGYQTSEFVGGTPILQVPSQYSGVRDAMIEKLGADPLKVSDTGESVLSRLCLFTDVVESSISSFAAKYPSLLAVESKRGTPLKVAWDKSRLKLCRSLVELGADVSCLWSKDEGKSVLMDLADSLLDRRQAFSTLVEWGVPSVHFDEAAKVALKRGNADLMQALVRAGAVIDGDTAREAWSKIVTTIDKDATGIQEKTAVKLTTSGLPMPPDLYDDFCSLLLQEPFSGKSFATIVDASPRSLIAGIYDYAGRHEGMDEFVLAIFDKGYLPSPESMSGLRRKLDEETMSEIESGMIAKTVSRKKSRRSEARRDSL